jgi:hypothetical protein
MYKYESLKSVEVILRGRRRGRRKEGMNLTLYVYKEMSQ